MPITGSDINIRLSTKAGTAGDTLASTPAESLGKYVSTSSMSAGINSLFDDITGDENAASTVDYRCIFVLNNHATLTLQNAKFWLESEVAGGANVGIAVDNVAPSAKGASAAQAALIATETTAPTSVGAFVAPTTKAAALSLGNLGPGQVRAVWVRRSATNSGSQANDGVTFAIAGDTL